MPQMSPLGWAWVVGFVVMGYLLFLVFLYYSVVIKFELIGEFFCVKSLSWLW